MPYRGGHGEQQRLQPSARKSKFTASFEPKFLFALGTRPYIYIWNTATPVPRIHSDTLLKQPALLTHTNTPLTAGLISYAKANWRW